MNFGHIRKLNNNQVVTTIILFVAGQGKLTSRFLLIETVPDVRQGKEEEYMEISLVTP